MTFQNSDMACASICTAVMSASQRAKFPVLKAIYDDPAKVCLRDFYNTLIYSFDCEGWMWLTSFSCEGWMWLTSCFFYMQRSQTCCTCNCGPQCGCENAQSSNCCSPYDDGPFVLGGRVCHHLPHLVLKVYLLYGCYYYHRKIENSFLQTVVPSNIYRKPHKTFYRTPPQYHIETSKHVSTLL